MVVPSIAPPLISTVATVRLPVVSTFVNLPVV